MGPVTRRTIIFSTCLEGDTVECLNILFVFCIEGKMHSGCGGSSLCYPERTARILPFIELGGTKTYRLARKFKPDNMTKTGKNICVTLLTVFKIYDVESGVVNHFLLSSAKKNNSKTLNHRVRLDLV